MKIDWPKAGKRIGYAVGYTFAALWIFLGGIFFYIRISFLVYSQNESRIQGAIESLRIWIQ